MFLRKKDSPIVILNVNEIEEKERFRLDSEMAKEIKNEKDETYIYGVFMLGTICNNTDKDKARASERIEKLLAEIKRLAKDI